MKKSEAPGAEPRILGPDKMPTGAKRRSNALSAPGDGGAYGGIRSLDVGLDRFVGRDESVVPLA